MSMGPSDKDRIAALRREVSRLQENHRRLYDQLTRVQRGLAALSDELEHSPDVRIPVEVAGPLARRIRALRREAQ